MATAPDQDFFPDARNPEDIRIINNRCLIRTQDGYCVVMVSGIVLAHYATTDRMGQAHAMVSLVEQGWANQIEVAAAFHQSVRTVWRQQARRPKEPAPLGLERLFHPIPTASGTSAELEPKPVRFFFSDRSCAQRGHRSGGSATRSVVGLL